MRVHAACELARAATIDGFDCAELNSLAALGAGGLYPANEHRDYRKLQERRRGPGQLEPQHITLRLLNEGGEGEIDVLTPMLAPYEVLHHLYNAGPLNFERGMLSKTVPLHAYWESYFADPESDVASHPLANDPEKWATAIPVLFFTDGAEFSKSSAAEGLHRTTKP
jgi:hypothetical protein